MTHVNRYGKYSSNKGTISGHVQNRGILSLIVWCLWSFLQTGATNTGYVDHALLHSKLRELMTGNGEVVRAEEEKEEESGLTDDEESEEEDDNDDDDELPNV